MAHVGTIGSSWLYRSLIPYGPCAAINSCTPEPEVKFNEHQEPTRFTLVATAPLSLVPNSVEAASRRSSSSDSSSGTAVDFRVSRRGINVASLCQAVSGVRGILAAGSLCFSGLLEGSSASAAVVGVAENRTKPKFYDLDGSGDVKALDIREGTGATPRIGEKVAIHYYARLVAKQGWRFDSSYEHKDRFGVPEPYIFAIGDGSVIAGLDTAVRSMKEGGVRRVIISPSQGYQNTFQGPIPPNFSDRQRLYTTIFNPTRLANGEGSTLGTLLFDIELLRVRPG